MRYRRLRIEGATYFFTVVTFKRTPIFEDPTAVSLLGSSIEKIRSGHPFETDAQVVLPDHLHALWTLPDGDADYSRRWRLIKEAFTRAYAKHQASSSSEQDRAPTFWQPRFWEHLIRDERDFIAHLDYIHLNPVHHGYVGAPRDWPYSTFRKWVARDTYEATWGSNEAPELPEWALRHE